MEENTPKISIIIPSYNRAEHILAAIRTAENQTYQNKEIVVVVDGSTDNTLEVLRDYQSGLSKHDKDALNIIYQENTGASGARNEGVRNSTGQYIAFLDDDDIWEPEKLQKQMDLIRGNNLENESLLLCTTDHFEIKDGETERTAIQNSGTMSLNGQNDLRRFSPTITWLLPRETFDTIGGFDTQIHAGEDADFVIQLRKADATFVNVPEPLATYNMPPEQKVYRDQEISAARSLAKNGDWFASVYPEGRLRAVTDWYRAVIPQALLQESCRQLESPKLKELLGCDNP